MAITANRSTSERKKVVLPAQTEYRKPKRGATPYVPTAKQVKHSETVPAKAREVLAKEERYTIELTNLSLEDVLFIQKGMQHVRKSVAMTQYGTARGGVARHHLTTAQGHVAHERAKRVLEKVNALVLAITKAEAN